MSKDETFDEELLSEILNPKLPESVGQKVTHLILGSCKTLRIVVDLDKVDKDATEITDISFTDVQNLSLEFRNNVRPGMIFVFTNIMFNQLSGSISTRSNNVKMFFRELNKLSRDLTSVIFKNINIGANLRLLNFQDIGHVRVIDSYFASIEDLDIPHTTKCHTSNRQAVVTCDRDTLFYSSTFR